MSRVIKYDFELPVRVRKHEVDVEGLRTLLRESKRKSGVTNRQLAEHLGRPVTEVEHWFRTDSCFSVPDATLWHELKGVIGIDTDEYDAQVTEFVERPGVFEKANRFYDSQGIAPTITSSSADEKIIVDVSQPRKLAGLWGARQAGSLWSTDHVAPTIKTPSGGYSQPLIIDEGVTKGDDDVSEIKFVGGIEGKSKWINDGKDLSRNYKQGDRVYDSDGISTTLTAQPIGNTGGYTNLYLVDEIKTKGDDAMRTKRPLTTASFRYASLFSGIGGFEQAFNILGGECVMASEIDKYANQAYEVLYGHPTVGDVTKVAAEDVPDHDLLVGGFPCQAFSVAGKRGGFDDARGTLFFEVARIAAEKKPKVLLLENVKGLVGHDKGKTLDTIVKTLNEIGYRVDFDILNSKYFGVPQNRERIFIVGVREDLIENQPWANMKGSTIIPKGKRRLAEYPDLKSFNFDWPSQDEVALKLIDILEPSVDERYYLSDEKTAELVAKLDERETANTPKVIHNIYGGFKEDKPRLFEGESPTIRTSAGGGHLPSVLEEDARGCSTRTRSYAGKPEQLEVRTDEVSNTITSVTKDAMVLKGLPIREATQKGYAIAEEGDVVNYKFPTSKTRRGRVGKQIAHTVEATAFSQGVVEGCVRNHGEIEPKDLSNTIDANYFKGMDNHGQRTQVLESPHYRIRKLTPLETFRLQGFPDEVHQKLVDAGISDSQRYKMAGNAVSVPVVEALGERLLPYLNGQQE